MKARGKRRLFAIAIALCLLLSGFAVAAGGLKLGKPIKVGYDPVDVAVGDFDNDGRKDLAVANFAASIAPDSKTSVSILAGKKGGGFKLVKTLNSGQPTGIEAARFGAGKELDLVVSTFTGQVEIYKGGKGFKFSAPKITAVPGAPRDVISGLFNNDRRRDFAVTRQDNDDVEVFYASKNSKSYGNPETYPGASSGFGIIAGRINNDSHADLVSINSAAGTFSVLLGQKKGGFVQKNYSLPNATSAAIADFDQDGNNDVAVATGAPQTRSGSRGGGPLKPAIALYKGSKHGKLTKDRTLKPKGIGKSFGFQLSAASLSGDRDPDLLLGAVTEGGGRALRRDHNKGSLTILAGKRGFSFESLKQFKTIGAPVQPGLMPGGRHDSLAVPLEDSNHPGTVRILSGK